MASEFEDIIARVKYGKPLKDLNDKQRFIVEDNTPNIIKMAQSGAITPEERRRRDKQRKKLKYEKKITEFSYNGKTFDIPNVGVKVNNLQPLINFLKEFNENPTVDNYNQLINKQPRDIQNTIRNYRYFLNGEKKGVFQSGSGEVIKKVFTDLNLKNDFPSASESLPKLNEKIIKASNVSKATEQASKVRLNETAKNIIKINNVFRENPDATLEFLAEKIHGNKFVKGSDIEKLNLTQKISDDVVRYLEVLEGGTGARKIPENLKSQWILPSDNEIKSIMNYIASNKGKGFRFREATLRAYKYTIRDSLLKLDTGTTRGLERKLKNLKGALDHVVGLSATHEIAPGYTEFYQEIEGSINSSKGKKIDQPFKLALKKALDGDWAAAEIYNKKALDFQTKNPGVDVPYLRQTDNPKQFIKYYDYLTDEAKTDILRLSNERNLVIETKSKPINKLIADETGGNKIKFSSDPTGVGTVVDNFEKIVKPLKPLMSILKPLAPLVRGAGKAAVVIDPLFAAMDFSKAQGEGLSISDSAKYTGKKFGQDLINLPTTAAGAVKLGYDYLKGDRGENLKYKSDLLYQPKTFGDESLETYIDNTPKGLLDYNKANLKYDQSAPNFYDDMEVPESQAELQSRKDAYLKSQGVSKPFNYFKEGIMTLASEKPSFTYPRITGIIDEEEIN